jgi:hypothetical protein
MPVGLLMSYPLAYLITFTTYGTWLHGDSRGSVDKQHNRYGDDLVALDAAREKKERIALENQPVVLSPEQDEQGTMMAFGQSPNANTQSPERK